MLQGNVDVVRRGFEAWGKGDLDALIAICDPTIDWEGLRDFLSAWERWQPDAEDYRELDGDRVLVRFQLRAHAKSSGLEPGRILANRAFVFHLRDGKVMKLAFYLDGERALADLGLTA